MELPCDLTHEQRALYDTAVEEWRILRVAVQQVGRDVTHMSGLSYVSSIRKGSVNHTTNLELQALVLLQSSSRDVWKTFWATQQRFFKLLCVSLKVTQLCWSASCCRV